MNPNNARRTSKVNPNNRITRRKIFLLAFVILVGGLLLPMGVIRAAAEMRQVAYPPATGGNTEIQNTGEHNSSKTNAKGPGEISQATTGTAESSVFAASAADLVITKTNDYDFDIGTSYRNYFKILITNTSTTTDFVGLITIQDDFPQGELTPTKVIPNESCSIYGNSVTCYYTTSTTIPAGQPLDPIRINVVVGTDALPQSKNTVYLDARDSNEDNNSAEDIVDIRYTDFEITKTVNNEFPQEKDTIDYLIEITNNGPYSSTNAELVIVDQLPIGVTYNKSNTSKGTYFPSTGRWKIDNLPVSETEELTITAKVDTGTTEDTITNIAFIDKTDVYDTNPANNSDSAKITVEGTDLHVKN